MDGFIYWSSWRVVLPAAAHSSTAGGDEGPEISLQEFFGEELFGQLGLHVHGVLEPILKDGGITSSGAGDHQLDRFRPSVLSPEGSDGLVPHGGSFAFGSALDGGDHSGDLSGGADLFKRSVEPCGSQGAEGDHDGAYGEEGPP